MCENDIQGGTERGNVRTGPWLETTVPVRGKEWLYTDDAKLIDRRHRGGLQCFEPSINHQHHQHPRNENKSRRSKNSDRIADGGFWPKAVSDYLEHVPLPADDHTLPPFPHMPADLSKSNAPRRRRTSSVRKDPEDIKFDSSHAREIELKRSRGEISCAECRRCDHRTSLSFLSLLADAPFFRLKVCAEVSCNQFSGPTHILMYRFDVTRRSHVNLARCVRDFELYIHNLLTRRP